MSLIVSLEGNIGAGKSTLVERLNKTNINKKIIFLQEPVEEWTKIQDSQGKNILQHFYEDTSKYSFPFQMMAYITRLGLIQQTIQENPNAIIFMERSLDTDKRVFAQMLYDSGKMGEIEFQIYNRWFDYFQPKEIPRKTIYLDVSPETCFERVKQRAREGESAITLKYLQDCHEYHQNMIKEISFSYPVLLINGNDESSVEEITSYLV